MTDAAMAANARALLDSADVACVTTIDAEGRPQSRAMFNLHNRDQFPALRGLFPAEGFETWFTTNTASRKMTDIARNRAVAALYCRPAEWRGLMLGGDFEIIDDKAAKRRLWQDGWELYYPQGPDDPDYAVLRLRPTLVKYYERLKTAAWQP